MAKRQKVLSNTATLVIGAILSATAREFTNLGTCIREILRTLPAPQKIGVEVVSGGFKLYTVDAVNPFEAEMVITAQIEGNNTVKHTVTVTSAGADPDYVTPQGEELNPSELIAALIDGELTDTGKFPNDGLNAVDNPLAIGCTFVLDQTSNSLYVVQNDDLDVILNGTQFAELTNANSGDWLEV